MFRTRATIRSIALIIAAALAVRSIFVEVRELKSPCEIACALKIGSELRMAGMRAEDEYVRTISTCSSQCDLEAGRMEQAPNLNLTDPCVSRCVMSTGADMAKAGRNLGHEYWHAMYLCPAMCGGQGRDEL